MTGHLPFFEFSIFIILGVYITIYSFMLRLFSLYKNININIDQKAKMPNLTIT